MLVEINLLPWRQIKRKQERRKLMSLVIAIFSLTTLFCLLVQYYIHCLNQLKNQDNQRLKEEIAVVNTCLQEMEKLKRLRATLHRRLGYLQELQNDSALTVHLMDELRRLLPAGLYLNQVKKRGNEIILYGDAFFNHAITLLMRKIEQNPWMQKPKLIEIKAKNSDRNCFSLSFILKAKTENFK